MKPLRAITLSLAVATGLASAVRANEPADSLPPLHGNWVQQLIQTNFHINDPRIRYPRFANFCRKVYNWGNDTFNTYDTDYVVGTGKNWKASATGTMWMQSYGYLFNIENRNAWENRIVMRSNQNYDFGVSLSFMAVSIGYTWNINRLANLHVAPRSTFDFAFSCALFAAELRKQSTSGNTVIERWGLYNDGHNVNIPLDNIHTDLFSISAYYFFNHRRFSQAAVYKFSKYQKRSSGSWMIGASYSQQDISMDFSDLPPEVLKFKPEQLDLHCNFNFHDFDIVGGYSYNAVMPHNWTFNITVLPGVGYKRWLVPGERDISELISASIDGRIGLTYNHRALFASASARIIGGFVFNSGYSFFSSTETASVIVGCRF